MLRHTPGAQRTPVRHETGVASATEQVLGTRSWVLCWPLAGVPFATNVWGTRPCGDTVAMNGRDCIGTSRVKETTLNAAANR